MPSDNDKRLQAILDRKAASDRQQAELKAAQEAAKADHERATAAAIRDWEADEKVIGSVIEKLNAQMAESGLRLDRKAEPNSTEPGSPLRQMMITLSEEATDNPDRRKRLVLNLRSHNFEIDPVFLIPHTGKPPAGKLRPGSDAETWEGLILAFMEQAVPDPSATRQRRS